MRDDQASVMTVRATGRQLRDALDHIEMLIVDGLRHGFFDCSITCQIGSCGKRQVVIRGGKSRKFTIPEDELPR